MTSGRVLACCRRTESREAREGRAVAVSRMGAQQLVAGEGEQGSRRGFSGGCSSPVAGGRRVAARSRGWESRAGGGVADGSREQRSRA